MRLSKAPNQEEVASLFLGSDFLKMVRARKKGDNLRILDFSYTFFPSDLSAKGFDFLERVKQVIKRSFSEKDLTNLNIYGVVSGGRVCVRRVSIPYVPKSEILQVVKGTIRKYVSFPIEEVIFDYSVLGETVESGTKRLAVVFIAISRRVLNQYLELFNSLGLRVVLLTTTCFSLQALLRGIVGSKSSILINLGYRETDISVFRGPNLLFARNIPIGVKDFEESFKKELGFSPEEAREWRRKWGIKFEEYPLELKKKVNSSRVKERILSRADIISKEIQLTLRHYHQITHGKEIERYIFFGGDSEIKGLREVLSKKLEIDLETTELSSFKNIDVVSEKKEVFEKLFSLYGDSTGVLLSKEEDLNLVRSEAEKLKRKRISILFLKIPALSRLPKGVIFLLCVVTLGLGYLGFLKFKTLSYRSQINKYKREIEKVKSKVEKIAEVIRRIRVLEEKKRFYQAFLRENPFYSLVWARICEFIPEQKIIFAEASFSKEKEGAVIMNLVGIALSHKEEKAPHQIITDLILNLENSRYFKNLSVETIPGGLPDIVGLIKKTNPRIEALSFILKGELEVEELNKKF